MENNKENDQWSRRNFVSVMAGIPLACCLPFDVSRDMNLKDDTGFPAKDMFAIKGTYINAAYTHPMSLGSYQEIRKFLDARMMNRQTPKGYDAFERAGVNAAFAKLINADPEEIAMVPSTMVGEN